MSTFCAMEKECKAYGQQTAGAALSAPRNLCPACELFYERVVKLLVYDYIDLSQLIGRKDVFTTDKITRPKPSSTPTIDLTVDALRTDIGWHVGTWEIAVRASAGLPHRALASREGFNVHAGVRILAPRVDHLAGLGPIVALHDGRDNPATERTGAQGLYRLADLHRITRRLSGIATPSTRLPGYCPACGSPSLYRDDGSDDVWCRGRHGPWTYQEYRLWVSMKITDFSTTDRN